MNRRISVRSLVRMSLASLLLAALWGATLAEGAAFVDKIKIVADGKAKSNGIVTIVFTPEGGTAKEIKVTVAKGMKEQEICRDIDKELTIALGEGYEVKQYDPDKIKVESSSKVPKFTLTVTEDVEGLGVQIK